MPYIVWFGVVLGALVVRKLYLVFAADIQTETIVNVGLPSRYEKRAADK